MKRFLLSLLAATALVLPLSAQAIIYQFNAQLLGANENPPTGSVSTGLASLFYDTATDTYDFTLSAFDLTGPMTVAHIHAQATPAENAGPRVGLDDAPFFVFNPGGGILMIGGNDVAAPAGMIPSTNGHPEATFLSVLRSGLAYVNVHTAEFPGGEIRGQLVEVSAIPEPGAWAMLLGGLGILGMAIRRKVRAD